MSHERAALVEAVRTNCHIADARHAADMALCSYLLQMREFFRWERALGYGAGLVHDEVGAWIAEREALWSGLEARPFVPLPCGPGGDALDPFDVAAVNRVLLPQGLLYGAGLVGAGRPVFFVAELHSHGRRDGLPLLQAGRELARGLVAPPAALDASSDPPSIVLRRESLARWCWEKFEVFKLQRHGGGALDEAVRAYGLDRDFDAALPRWLDEQGEAMVLHELGEHRAGLRLGPGWAAMRLALSRRGDLHARALRDLLADLEVTLPALLERGADASIHVWFANFDGVRETLGAALKPAYRAWRDGDGGFELRRCIERGSGHFEGLARRALALHESGGDAAVPAIEELLAAPAATCPA